MYGAFKGHITDDMKILLVAIRLNLVMVPTDCTTKCQPLDVSIKKSFKSNCWENYVVRVATNLCEEDQES